MKLIYRTLVITLLILSLIINVGCQKTTVTSNDKKKTIEVIVKMKEAEFWRTVRIGAEAAGEEFGVNVIFEAPDNEEDISGQIKIVNDAIQKKVDAIVLAASDYKRLVDITEKAAAQGISVLIIDSALDSSKVSTFISTNNYEAGKMMGYQLVERVGEKCDIAIMNFIEGTASADDRKKGLLDVIKDYPDIKVLAEEYCFSDEKLASRLTEDLIKKYKNINAIVALNAQSTIGAANTVVKSKLDGKVKIIGFDCCAEEVDFIEADVIQSVIVQNPYAMGYLGIKNAVKVLNNETVPRFIETQTVQIDKNKIYLPENQRLLFPFVE